MAVVQQIGRLKLFHADEVERRRGLLQLMLADDAYGDERLGDALAYARQAVSRLPELAPAVVMTATIAAALGRGSQARRTLERGWERAPHPEIALAYAGLSTAESPLERLQRLGRLRKLRPDHALTHIVLAELAMAAERWEYAKQHLDTALELEPTAGVYRLYADFERASGGGDEKARSWLAKTLDAEPDPCWLCEDSGEILPEWQLYGPTGSFDSVHWERPLPRSFAWHRGNGRPTPFRMRTSPNPRPRQPAASTAARSQAGRQGNGRTIVDFRAPALLIVPAARAGSGRTNERPPKTAVPGHLQKLRFRPISWSRGPLRPS